MRSLGRHLRLAREHDVPPALPWQRPPVQHVSGWVLVGWIALAIGGLFVVGAAEDYVLTQLGAR